MVSEAARVQAATHPLEVLEARVNASKQVAWAEKGSVTTVLKKNVTTLKARSDALGAFAQQRDEICRVYQEPEACAGATYLYGVAAYAVADQIDAFEARLPGDMDGDGEEFGVVDTEFQDRLVAALRASAIGSVADEGLATLRGVVEMTAARPGSAWGRRAWEELAQRSVPGDVAFARTPPVAVPTASAAEGVAVDAEIDALYQTARAAESGPDRKLASTEWTWNQLDQTFRKAIADGKPVSDASRARAAAHPLEVFEAAAGAFPKRNWSSTGTALKDIKANVELVKAKFDALGTMREQARVLCEVYRDLESCAGARFVYGQSALVFGDLIEEFETLLPGDMDGDGEEWSLADTEYQDRLVKGIDETFGPRASEGGAVVRSVVEMTSARPDSVWGQRAREELARRQAKAAADAAARTPAPPEAGDPGPSPWNGEVIEPAPSPR